MGKDTLGYTVFFTQVCCDISKSSVSRHLHCSTRQLWLPSEPSQSPSYLTLSVIFTLEQSLQMPAKSNLIRYGCLSSPCIACGVGASFLHSWEFFFFFSVDSSVDWTYGTSHTCRHFSNFPLMSPFVTLCSVTPKGFTFLSLSLFSFLAFYERFCHLQGWEVMSYVASCGETFACGQFFWLW